MVCALGAVLVVSACGQGPAERQPVVDETTESTPGRWQIGVGGVQDGDPAPCIEDPSVADTWQSASYPSSSMGLALVADASGTDAERIAQCLRTALPANEVTVTRVEQTQTIPEGSPVIGAEPVGPDPSAAPVPDLAPAPGAFPPCASAAQPPPITEGGGAVGATACSASESEQLTEEEMQNAQPMPMPMQPGPAAEPGQVAEPGRAVPAEPLPAESPPVDMRGAMPAAPATDPR